MDKVCAAGDALEREEPAAHLHRGCLKASRARDRGIHIPLRSLRLRPRGLQRGKQTGQQPQTPRKEIDARSDMQVNCVRARDFLSDEGYLCADVFGYNYASPCVRTQ